MWAKIAENMQLPWQTVEAMHWDLGVVEMAERAGVVRFTWSLDKPQGTQRSPLTNDSKS